jgi:hypothetical protein
MPSEVSAITRAWQAANLRKLVSRDRIRPEFRHNVQ